jgi:hypothetical protein
MAHGGGEEPDAGAYKKTRNDDDGYRHSGIDPLGDELYALLVRLQVKRPAVSLIGDAGTNLKLTFAPIEYRPRAPS